MSLTKKTSITFGVVYVLLAGLSYVFLWLKSLVLPVWFAPGFLTCQGVGSCLNIGPTEIGQTLNSFLIFGISHLIGLLLYFFAGMILAVIISTIFPHNLRRNYFLLLVVLVCFVLFFPKEIVSGGFGPLPSVVTNCLGFPRPGPIITDATVIICHGIPYQTSASR